MTYLDTYVCPWNPAGGTPMGIGPRFPCTTNGRAWYEVIWRIDDGRFKEWIQTDWGCWIAKVTKAQLLAFIHEIYADVIADPNSTAPRPVTWAEVEDILRAAAELDDNTFYGLVAKET
jgi:hypothetical protein